MATYLEAQLGFVDEVTYGTRVAPTRFLEFNEESLKLNIDYMQSAAYRAGRKTAIRRRPGRQTVTGDIGQELSPQGLGLWMKHMFGGLVTAGAGPYTHTFTPGAIDGKSLSIQVGRTDEGGTTRPFDYSGCKITGWEIEAKVGEIAMLKSSIYGIVEVTNQTLATASYPSGILPFTWTEASLTIGGTATPVKGLTLKGENGLLVDRHRIQATNPARSKEPKEASTREYSGTLEADFTDLTAYNRFVNQTQATLVVTFSSGATSLVITSTVEFDGETPNASGSGNEPEQSLPFVGVNATSDANVITAVLTNADSTA